MPGIVQSTRLTITVALLVVMGAPQASAASDRPDRHLAAFEGDTLDLAGDWGDATACLVWDDIDVVECFETETEMDHRIADLESEQESMGSLAAAVRCSTSVRLYSGTGFTGAVLALRDRSEWVNLSSHGFSNRTSSFRIGACGAYFADHANGGGDWYASSATQSLKSASVMASGWDNRVSSIYLR